MRYNEKIGLMPDPPHGASGYRAYNENHDRRLRFILRARELGFTIEEIRGLLELVDGGNQTCAEVKKRTEKHLADVHAKLVDLAKLERILADTVARCSGESSPPCPVLDMLDAGRNQRQQWLIGKSTGHDSYRKVDHRDPRNVIA
ncbi:MAG: MerR family DNA-binding protein [Proteobacteria bacterium]|nr:MerR family DNA-binding protein [Pseudomonadota bacterium]